MVLEFLKHCFLNTLVVGLSWTDGTSSFELLADLVQPSDSKPAIYIYDGPGTDLGCLVGAAYTFRQILQPDAYNIHFISADAVKEGKWAQEAALFLMPGGADLPYLEALAAEGNAAIRQYVEAGGAYLGFCAGAYYAAKEILFAPGTDLEVIGPRPLQFFDGVIYGPVLAPYDYRNYAGARVAEVLWLGGSLAENSTIFHCYYDGGGAFLNAQNLERTAIVGYLDNQSLNLPEELAHAWIVESLKTQGVVGIVETRYGRGHAILSSCHPEIPVSLLRWKNRWSQDPYLDELLPKLDAAENERLELMRLICEHLGLKTKSM